MPKPFTKVRPTGKNPAKGNARLSVSPTGITTQEKDLQVARLKNIGNAWEVLAFIVLFWQNLTHTGTSLIYPSFTPVEGLAYLP
ncbi:hypothetical protein LC593_26120 [Nostoc sp. CHAB 5844]|nr:hypothetical protein [Nostoc sp. CHAB 5844]